ncbi:MAG: hypothetical protein D3903_08905 [Candidatus Electrothrix sp. GM3_4]|nr:hypothetical protein [Candidatus Electrothrix sp. GM3_4]
MKGRQSLLSSMTGLAVFSLVLLTLAAQAGVQPAIVVDGQYGEWDLNRDNSRPMHAVRTCKGRKGRKCIGEQVPNVYLHHDSITNTIFVLVLQEDGVQGGKNKPVVNIYALGQKIPAGLNDAGKISDFSWVMDADKRVGWEGAFQLTPGTYDCNTELNTVKKTKAASEVKVLDTKGMLFKCD